MYSKTFAKREVDYKNFPVSYISSGKLDAETLQAIKKSAGLRESLTSSEKKEIEQRNADEEAADKQLDIIYGKKEKKHKGSGKNLINQERNIEKEILEMQKRTELARLALQEDSYEKIGRINQIELDTTLSKYDEEIEALRKRGELTNTLS